MLPSALSMQVNEAHAWLSLAADQLTGNGPWLIDLGDNPMGQIEAVNNLRPVLRDVGVVVPPMRDMNADPLGNMMDWRDFLAAVRTVN